MQHSLNGLEVRWMIEDVELKRETASGVSSFHEAFQTSVRDETSRGRTAPGQDDSEYTWP